MIVHPLKRFIREVARSPVVLSESEKDAKGLIKINAHAISKQNPGIPPRDLQQQALEGPIFPGWVIDFVKRVNDADTRGLADRKGFIKWMANSLKGDMRWRTSRTILRGIVDWVIGTRLDTQGLQAISWPDAIKASEEWHQTIGQTAREIELDNRDVVHDFGDGYVVVRLSCDDLGDEGDVMGHCVGTHRVDDQNQIFSLRDGKNRPHATIEVTSGEVVEIKGKQNEVPIPKYGKMIDAWLQSSGYDYEKCEDYTMMKLNTLSPEEKKQYFFAMADAGNDFYEIRGMVERMLTAKEVFELAKRATPAGAANLLEDPNDTILDLIMDEIRSVLANPEGANIERLTSLSSRLMPFERVQPELYDMALKTSDPNLLAVLMGGINSRKLNHKSLKRLAQHLARRDTDDMPDTVYGNNWKPKAVINSRAKGKLVRRRTNQLLKSESVPEPIKRALQYKIDAYQDDDLLSYGNDFIFWSLRTMKHEGKYYLMWWLDPTKKPVTSSAGNSEQIELPDGSETPAVFQYMTISDKNPWLNTHGIPRNIKDALVSSL